MGINSYQLYDQRYKFDCKDKRFPYKFKDAMITLCERVNGFTNRNKKYRFQSYETINPKWLIRNEQMK